MDHFLPPVLGATLVAVALWLHGRARVKALVVAGAAPLVIDVARLAASGESSAAQLGTAFEFAAVVLGSCVAAGNHVRRVYPASEAARRMTGLAGWGLALVALAYGWAKLWSPGATLPPGERWEGRNVLVGASLAYAVLGAASLARSGEVKFRTRLLSVVGRAVVFLGSAAYAAARAFEFRAQAGPPFRGSMWLVVPGSAANMVATACGWVVVPALALAVWFEERLRARRGPVDPGALDRVFQ